MIVIENCAIATVGPAGEIESGHVVVDGARIAAVGPGPAPDGLAALEGASRIDAGGCLATPGLVNCHHHLYQWLTRGLSQQSKLFDWLTELYPVWAQLDGELVLAGARAALAELLLSGCTTSTDHHYVFPSGAGDLLAPTIEAAAGLGIRFHPTRGSMDLGRSSRTPTTRWPPPRPPSTAGTTRRPGRCCGSRSRPARPSPPPRS
jgi:cytosine/adenosine deaminase-related metal-dependent hydrolase